MNIIGCLSSRYIDGLAQRQLLSIPTAKNRVYAYVKWQESRDYSLSSLTGKLGEELASELNLTRESVYRAISELRKEGLITKEGSLLAYEEEKNK